MKIRFYDEDDNPIVTIDVEQDNYWDACLEGHRCLHENVINEAREFDVLD
ncbi:hypothetical protein [uncultured Cohaesibacter sp.]|nr:hypothetical protein [uncultured Cohaesibacter sp.]